MQGIWPQGAPASPANMDSGGSARRKSFSPLDTGPVSILPMVESPETGLPSISNATLAWLLGDPQHSGVTAVKIVDCRSIAPLVACVFRMFWFTAQYNG